MRDYTQTTVLSEEPAGRWKRLTADVTEACKALGLKAGDRVEVTVCKANAEDTERIGLQTSPAKAYEILADSRWDTCETKVAKFGPNSRGVLMTDALSRNGYRPGDPIVIAIPKKGYRLRRTYMMVPEEGSE